MSSVLFDTAGPRTRARYRLYTLLASVVVVLIVGFFIWRMWDTGQFAYAKWEPFLTPVYIKALLVDGLLKTLEMAATSIIFAVILGALLGIGKLSDRAWIGWPCWAVVEFFRAVPLLLLIVFIFFAYGIGEGGIGSYWSVVIGLTLYNGSVLAEVFRAGINAVPRGQSEAAYALGMRKSQVMITILMPQGVKIMLPAIISQCVVALKDTSLGFYVLAPGLTRVGKDIYTQFANHVQTALVLAAIYILVNLALSWVATRVQRRFVGENKKLAVTAGEDQSTAVPGGLV
jgi:glutamate transport system permease protein